MEIVARLRRNRLMVFSALTGLSLIPAACPSRRPSSTRVLQILERGAPSSKDSFYTCLWNGYAQGLPLKQIQAECETKLSYDDGKGFGKGNPLGPFARTSTWFDPASVAAACNLGDSGRAAGSAVDGWGGIQWNYQDARGHIDWGKYSWGGKDKCDSQGCYKGLTEDESSKEKDDAIREANKKFLEWQAAQDAAKNADDAAKSAEADAQNDPGNKKKQADAANKKKEAAAKDKEAEAKKQEAQDAADKAGKDPNKKDDKKGSSQPTSHPVGPGESPCEQALQAAREIVGECQRTAWRSGSCQSLWAKMHDCPDPELIYVDPESGYTCGHRIDAEALKQAWLDRCHQLRRPVPGGPDPCESPSVDRWGHYIEGRPPSDMCNNPAAHVDPDNPPPECVATLTIQTLTPSAQSLLVWGLNKFGGPIVVLPERNPNPQPGPPHPEPQPGPKP